MVHFAEPDLQNLFNNTACPQKHSQCFVFFISKINYALANAQSHFKCRASSSDQMPMFQNLPSYSKVISDFWKVSVRN